MLILARAKDDLVIKISRPNQGSTCSKATPSKDEAIDLACVEFFVKNML
jgi:hypothetical protein